MDKFLDEETLMKYLTSPKRYYKSLIPTGNNGPLIIGHRAELLRLVDFVSEPLIHAYKLQKP